MEQPKRYLIHVEYECPLQVWGKPAKENEWRIHESSESPRIGQFLGNSCGEPYFLEACDDGKVYCEERGRIAKVEEFSPGRAKQLGLEVLCK